MDTTQMSQSTSEEIDIFTQHLDGLFQTLPLTYLIIESVFYKANDEYAKFIEGYCETLEEDERTFVQVKDIGDNHRLRTLSTQFTRAEMAKELVPRSFLVTLVSQYDAFLGGLLKILFSYKPEILSTSERALTFAQLVDFKTVEAAKEYILEKEIDSILRESHAEQFRILERKFNIELRKNLPIWQTFIEVTERRNLFVHSNGVITSQYLKVCQEQGVKLGEDAILGTKLTVEKKYFYKAYLAIYEIGVKLAHTLWRKLAPDLRLDADWHLIGLGFELLREEKYGLARILFDFAVGLPKFGSNETKRTFIINRAQSYKWLGEEDTARKILQAEDWSDTNDKFKLTVAVLTEDYEGAIKLMQSIGASGSIGKTDYRDWPLFKEFIKREDFLTTFKEVFGIDFAEIQYKEDLTVSAPKEVTPKTTHNGEVKES